MMSAVASVMPIPLMVVDVYKRQALHMNLEEHLSKEQYRHLLRVAAAEG